MSFLSLEEKVTAALARVTIKQKLILTVTPSDGYGTPLCWGVIDDGDLLADVWVQGAGVRMRISITAAPIVLEMLTKSLNAEGIAVHSSYDVEEDQ